MMCDSRWSVQRDSSGEYKVLLPLLNPGLAPELVDLAGRLAGGRPGRVIILGIVEVPPEAPLSEGLSLARAYRIMLDNLAERISGRVEVETMVRVHRQAWRGIVEQAVQEQCDLLLMPWKGFSSRPDHVYGSTIDAILKNPPCDTVIAKGPVPSSCRRLLLPVRGGPHAELALRVARALAAGQDATITVLHDRSSEAEGRSDGLFDSFRLLIEGSPVVNNVVHTTAGVLPSILQEAPKHDLLIMGATADLLPGTSSLGPVIESVSSKIEQPVLVVKTKQWLGAAVARHLAPDGHLDKSSFLDTVDRWFAENTFHSREFEDLEHLIELKRRGLHSVSVAVPMGERPKAVTGFARVLKEEFQQRLPLLDEVVLVVNEAEAACGIPAGLGVPVLVPSHLLPRWGHFPGRGEQVWKTAAALKGDLIVWLDTENRRSANPAKVAALLGPLLREPGITLVKGFHTPASPEGEHRIWEGDPLTDLVVRPLLNLLVPGLSGMADPLCGQWAIRRSALETLPLQTGYGFDVALLLDLHARHGLEAIAQVDLGEDPRRPGACRETAMLAANAIVQVFVRRFENQLGVSLLEDYHRSAKSIKRLETGYRLEVAELRERERPPLLEVPEYVSLQDCAAGSIDRS